MININIVYSFDQNFVGCALIVLTRLPARVLQDVWVQVYRIWSPLLGWCSTRGNNVLVQVFRIGLLRLGWCSTQGKVSAGYVGTGFCKNISCVCINTFTKSIIVKVLWNMEKAGSGCRVQMWSRSYLYLCLIYHMALQYQVQG